MYSILIVDDEPAIVEGLAVMLPSYSLPLKDLKIAYSAVEAVELCKKTTFDIVISDIRMPEMDGLELLKTIHELWRNTKVILLTGYSDFKYAQQAVKLGAADYLLKPVEDDELVACIQKVAAELEQEFYRLLEVDHLKSKVKSAQTEIQSSYFREVLDHWDSIDEASMKQRFIEINLPFNTDKSVNTVIIRIDDWGNRFQQGDISLIQFGVHNILEEMLCDKRCNLATFHYDDGMIGGIIQEFGENNSNLSLLLNKRLEEIQNIIYRGLGITISITIAENLTWQQWPSGIRYRTACLKQNLGNGIMITTNYNTAILKDEDLTRTLSEIVESIKKRDLNMFSEKLCVIFQRFEDSKIENNNNLALFYMELSSIMLNSCIEYNISELLQPLYIERMTNLYSFKNIPEMRSFWLNVFKVIVESVGTVENNSCENLIKRIKKYINDNIGEDLSLDHMSKKFRINPSYLSRVFHQVTGEQLSAYITTVKMDYARKLLLNEDLKVYEISQKVGYDNPNYFAKVFRKIVGISPIDYRNLTLR